MESDCDEIIVKNSKLSNEQLIGSTNDLLDYKTPVVPLAPRVVQNIPISKRTLLSLVTAELTEEKQSELNRVINAFGPIKLKG